MQATNTDAFYQTCCHFPSSDELPQILLSSEIKLQLAGVDRNGLGDPIIISFGGCKCSFESTSAASV